MKAERERLLALVDEWESEAAVLTWPEDSRIVAETLRSCASEVRAIISTFGEANSK